MEAKDLINFKNWLNENHEGMYIKISDYTVKKYLKEISGNPSKTT